MSGAAGWGGREGGIFFKLEGKKLEGRKRLGKKRRGEHTRPDGRRKG